MRDVDVQEWLAIQTWPDLRSRLDATPQLVAYEHPYGFVVCRLEDTPVAGWQIRVHLWPSRREMERLLTHNRTNAQQVHAHGWDIVSQVVLGAVEESGYRLTPDPGAEQSVYRAVSDYGAGTSRLNLEQVGVRVDLVDRRLRHSGDGVLTIPRGTYHSSISGSAPGVTVVATEVSGGDSFVVAPRHTAPTVVNARRSVPDLHELLTTFDRLHESRPGDEWASFIFLVTATNDVLLVRSTRRPEQWQPVGGRQEPADLSPVRTLQREAREEVGVALEGCDLRPLVTLPRDVGTGDVHFYLAYLPERPGLELQRAEVLDHRWVPLTEVDRLPMYPGSRAALPFLRDAVLGTSSGA